ncbi:MULTISPECIES: hypothetical protein [unclassified Microbacterium]|uniref:hypothetical protein n=1 Tax=unclassified Microbacterium TaxID=2609290 RepID=UPI000EAA0C8B|nr:MULTISPECIES: hypothetical protein [unclassified Microbacterium]MBT2484830.1 hypothetical protein [Microbacterium sp. ISL-108]RKN67700.1 hypothetical protein D7252_08935 [Microbacterium sp. CGR2]
MSAHDLNSADYERIEAALRHLIPETKRTAAKWHPKGLRAFNRTLRKIERINKTGEFTQQ